MILRDFVEVIMWKSEKYLKTVCFESIRRPEFAARNVLHAFRKQGSYNVEIAPMEKINRNRNKKRNIILYWNISAESMVIYPRNWWTVVCLFFNYNNNAKCSDNRAEQLIAYGNMKYQRPIDSRQSLILVVWLLLRHQ